MAGGHRPHAGTFVNDKGHGRNFRELNAMKKNMGPVQRAIWVVAGLVLIAWALFGSGDYRWIGWIGIVPLATGAIGWCAINAVLGINTCKNC